MEELLAFLHCGSKFCRKTLAHERKIVWRPVGTSCNLPFMAKVDKTGKWPMRQRGGENSASFCGLHPSRMRPLTILNFVTITTSTAANAKL